MRLIHTSDWHLGQTLHNFDRAYEHQCFLDWLVDTLVNEQADALLIAGDVFDNANPSAASQKQLYGFLTQAKRRLPRLNIVIVAGNHDSPARLEAPGPLLDVFDTVVIGNMQRKSNGEPDIERLVVPLKNSCGEIAAWCLALPFLRPSDIRWDDGAADPYQAGIASQYKQAFDLACTKRQPGQAIVAMGHCHMVEGQSSMDSERRIVVGNATALPADIFDPGIAYAALGHLHLAQAIGKQKHVRYSGSPLPMSFSEVDYPHQVLRIDLEGEMAREITPIRVPRAVDLLRIPRQPAPLAQVIAALQELGADDLPPQAFPYLEVRVLLDAHEPALRAQIEQAIAGKPVRLAKIEVSAAKRDEAAMPALSLDEFERLDPQSVFNRLYQEKHGTQAPDDLMAAFAELLAGPAEERQAA